MRRMNGRASPTITRLEDLIYAVDELPPWPRLIFHGAQHATIEARELPSRVYDRISSGGMTSLIHLSHRVD